MLEPPSLTPFTRMAPTAHHEGRYRTSNPAAALSPPVVFKYEPGCRPDYKRWPEPNPCTRICGPSYPGSHLRATGITRYPGDGGTLEDAQRRDRKNQNLTYSLDARWTRSFTRPIPLFD